MKIRIGSLVRLKGKKKIATVTARIKGITGGVVLSPTISGFRCWNVQDLEVAVRQK